MNTRLWGVVAGGIGLVAALGCSSASIPCSQAVGGVTPAEIAAINAIDVHLLGAHVGVPELTDGLLAGKLPPTQWSPPVENALILQCSQAGADDIVEELGAIIQEQGADEAPRLALLIAQRHFAEAEQILSCWPCSEQDPIYWRYQMWLAEQMGRTREALSAADHWVGLQGDTATALATRGWLAYRIDRTDRALADFEAALRRDANCGWARHGLGVLKRDFGDLDGALLDLTYASILRPRDAAPLFDRANAYRALGRPVEAQADDTAATTLERERLANLDRLRMAVQHLAIQHQPANTIAAQDEVSATR